MIDFDWLIKNGPCKKYFAGQLIPEFLDNNPTERAMYLVVAGSVDIIKSGAQAGTYTRGEVFGGREFFYGTEDTAYLTGSETILFPITEKSFDNLARTQPGVIMEILKSAYANKGMASEKPEAKATTPEAKAMKPEAKAMKPEAKAMEITEGGVFPPGHKGYPGVTKPEHAKLVFPKEYECPYCKKKFTDFRVSRSKLFQSGPIRYDLRRFYTGFIPEWYDVITCPHCYFSTYYTYYSDPKPLLKNAVEAGLAAAKESVKLDFAAERDLDFVFASHYLAIISSAGYVPTGRQLRARIWGNISWLYEDAGDEEMTRFAAGKAAEAYEAVYMESRLTPVQEQTACLTIAGMLYRAGHEENLRKYLYTAKTIKSGDRIYAQMADDMTEMLREKQEKAGNTQGN